jgi:hypothetical protein
MAVLDEEGILEKHCAEESELVEFIKALRVKTQKGH